LVPSLTAHSPTSSTQSAQYGLGKREGGDRTNIAALGRLWTQVRHRYRGNRRVLSIVISTAAGLESIDRELLELTRSLDASGLKVFLKVRMPWAMPHIFSGLKVAITLAVIGAIVAEFIGADTGLGYLILTNSGALKTSVVFFVLLILSLLGIALFYAVEAIERAVCPWYTSDATKAENL
jgi:ABC-type proline/glycine betaine transport system permease subunit